MRFHSRLLRALLLSALTWATVTASHAQSGEGPLRIVVGFPAGGSADTIARLLADKLRLDFQRPVLVDNRPGAGGRIAAMALKGLPRDGSVVMLAPDALVTTNPLVFRKPCYEVADLVPISLVAEFAFAFATGAETGAKSFPEYVAWARANRPRADFGSPAPGSPLHFIGLMVGKDIGVDLVHVPFQGGPPLLTAMIGGHVSAGINTLTDMLEMHRNGRVRILAVPGSTRDPRIPDVPTFSELGFKQVVARGFFGLYAPAGTSAASVERWNAAMRRVLVLPEVRQRLGELAFDPKPSSPEELAKKAKDETAIWAPVIKASGFSMD
jgi:tripartite-type tricarboxylate transporter receptor subunit TctC